MRAAIVVISDEQGKRRFVVAPLFGMSVRQTGIPANLHPQCLVLSFTMACANLVLIRVADNYRSVYGYYFTGRVPPGRSLLGRRAEYLDDLAVIDVRPEDFAYGTRVGIEAVRGQLEAIRASGPTEFFREL